jgi:hypothetical protein
MIPAHSKYRLQARSMSRRDFLSRMSAAGVGVGVTGSLVAHAERVASRTGAVDAVSVNPLSEVDRFNYVVGTQTFSPLYHFTTKPRLAETAEAIREMGASVIKLRLRPEQGDGAEAVENGSLRRAAESNPVMKQILEMPFANFVLWAYPGSGPHRVGTGARDEEIYELCCYLLTRFNRTGKAFYLGHWEGDWELRGKAGGSNDPTPEAIAHKIKWLNRRQKAVDDAKRDTSHEDVDVFCYAEANRVKDSMIGRPGMINSVVPETNIDFVSYSSYDTTADRATGLEKVLDYMESKLPAKAGVKGKRVWIGEYGFPRSKFSAAEQDARSREVIKVALEWGCPFGLYWEMYNNELDKDGKQRGFWLIDEHGEKQPVYYTHQRLLQWGREFVSKRLKAEKRAPSFEEYRKGALEVLGKMGA